MTIKDDLREILQEKELPIAIDYDGNLNYLKLQAYEAARELGLNITVSTRQNRVTISPRREKRVGAISLHSPKLMPQETAELEDDLDADEILGG
jgi:hypothetical protein